MVAQHDAMAAKRATLEALFLVRRAPEWNAHVRASELFGIIHEKHLVRFVNISWKDRPCAIDELFIACAAMRRGAMLNKWLSWGSMLAAGVA
jgi:hypothetical protein